MHEVVELGRPAWGRQSLPLLALAPSRSAGSLAILDDVARADVRHQVAFAGRSLVPQFARPPKATALRHGEGAHEDQEANLRSAEAVTLTLDVSLGRMRRAVRCEGLADSH
jgi:hypothetical protein